MNNPNFLERKNQNFAKYINFAPNRIFVNNLKVCHNRNFRTNFLQTKNLFEHRYILVVNLTKPRFGTKKDILLNWTGLNPVVAYGLILL